MSTLKDDLEQKMGEKKKGDFQQLVNEPQFSKIPKRGDIVKGKVMSASRSLVKIDLDGLRLGVVRGVELHQAPEYANLKPGDEVEATVVEMENEDGEVELSFQAAGFRKAWDSVFNWRKEGKIVGAKVKDANQGGLLMTLESLSGFMPVSQLSPEHYPRVAGGDRARILEKLQSFIGQTLNVKVLDFNERENKLIFSEKAVWEEEKKTLLGKYKVGDEVEGVVTALTDFGAFVKFSAQGGSASGGDEVEGLIHISEIAWQRLDHPRDVLKMGETMKAQIIQIDGSKIFLSRKRLMDDPWKQVGEKYKVGEVVKGKILKINPFGFFVELDTDIHGLAHISSLGASTMNDLTAIAKEGDTRDFEIITLEPAEHRLGLKLTK